MNRLKDLREDKDYNQKDVADLLNISQQQYSLYELWKREIPISLLCVLAKHYNTSIDYLMGRTNERKTYPENNITDSYFDFLIKKHSDKNSH